MGINDIMENLRNEIWKKIAENDYTLKKFAKICGISYGNLRKIISGTNNDINTSTILRICKNSGIKVNDIFQEDAPKLIDAVVTYNNTKYHGTLSK